MATRRQPSLNTRSQSLRCCSSLANLLNPTSTSSEPTTEAKVYTLEARIRELEGTVELCRQQAAIEKEGLENLRSENTLLKAEIKLPELNFKQSKLSPLSQHGDGQEALPVLGLEELSGNFSKWARHLIAANHQLKFSLEHEKLEVHQLRQDLIGVKNSRATDRIMHRAHVNSQSQPQQEAYPTPSERPDSFFVSLVDMIIDIVLLQRQQHPSLGGSVTVILPRSNSGQPQTEVQRLGTEMNHLVTENACIKRDMAAVKYHSTCLQSSLSGMEKQAVDQTARLNQFKMRVGKLNKSRFDSEFLAQKKARLQDVEIRQLRHEVDSKTKEGSRLQIGLDVANMALASQKRRNQSLEESLINAQAEHAALTQEAGELQAENRRLVEDKDNSAAGRKNLLLRDRIDLMGPIVENALPVRRRFLLQGRKKPESKSATEAGNRAAHDGNSSADASLYRLCHLLLSDEAWFEETYGASLNEFWLMAPFPKQVQLLNLRGSIAIELKWPRREHENRVTRFVELEAECWDILSSLRNKRQSDREASEAFENVVLVRGNIERMAAIVAEIQENARERKS
ncbi:uncharacterized protein LY89DRAFT_673212 [Mollisia scopiformis]|uniref:Uncharacterized protein n=1 Tax=Mollisia scopiformis TaxID=149040 RepID=A0A194WYU5_MOLSC|nr:uncharacterized protein LY89DRAFT_673212 [Mollisia scopiformis]KUJ13115.1 hypothetical protein LY89DRAFT_673212 [Mollisia scopiformis]